MKWRGLDCRVVVDGVKLPEYDDPQSETDGKTTSCWIASESGSEYNVEMEMLGQPPALPLAYDLFIDNELVEEALNHADRWSSPVKIRGKRVDDGTRIRKFRFTLLSSSDDDNVPTRDMSGLGSIRLVVFQWRDTVKATVPQTYETSSALDQEPRIHEKCKKVAQHCTLLGEPQSAGLSPENYTGHAVDETLDEYRHTFIFKYQPIELLQARDIAPPPSKSELEKYSSSKRKLDAICKEEDRFEQDHERELHRLEKQRRLLLEECRNIDETLTRLNARSSKPHNKVKLEYQERLTALDGQVFEISD